jgi:enoyl-CoA hydratase
MPDDQLVRLQLGEVTEIELNNPPLNLVTSELTTLLGEVLTTVANEPSVRAVVVCGTGERAFCAGSHVAEFEGLHGRVAEGKLLLEKLVYRRLAELPMPTIAALHADALGGGLELALACDLRVAAASARLGMPEVRLGVMPGSGGTQRLPRVIGIPAAKELILTGELIDAAEAHRLGLVNRIVPAGQARETAGQIAATIAERGPLAVREAKRAIDATQDLSIDAGLAAELDASERIFSSEDMLEGAQAFFEKRPPRFRGR